MLDIIWKTLVVGAIKLWESHDKQVALEQEQARARQEEHERAQRCCATCTAVVNSKNAAFCHNCGGATFTTVGTIRDKKAAEEAKRQKAEEQRRQQKLAEEQARQEELERQRQHRKAARNRCLELLAMLYCPRCNTAYSPSHKFCTTCGTATEAFHEQWAYKYAHDEFPDVVRTENDFKQLVNDRS